MAAMMPYVFSSCRNKYLKIIKIKKTRSRYGPLFCLCYQEGFLVVSSTEFNQFCIVLGFGFIVEASVILLSSTMLTFFKMAADKIFFCVLANKAYYLANMAVVSLF